MSQITWAESGAGSSYLAVSSDDRFEITCEFVADGTVTPEGLQGGRYWFTLRENTEDAGWDVVGAWNIDAEAKQQAEVIAGGGRVLHCIGCDVIFETDEAFVNHKHPRPAWVGELYDMIRARAENGR